MKLGELRHYICYIRMSYLKNEKLSSFGEADCETRPRCDSRAMFTLNEILMDSSMETLEFDAEDISVKKSKINEDFTDFSNYANKPNFEDRFCKEIIVNETLYESNNISPQILITSNMYDDGVSDEEINSADNVKVPFINNGNLHLDRDSPNGKLNLGLEQNCRSYSSFDSSMKSDICNGNCSRSHSLKIDQKDQEEENTLIVRDADRLENQATTPTGSCLKAGSKSSAGGVHVQFETPRDAQDSFIYDGIDNFTDEKPATANQYKSNEPFSKLWTRLQPESTEYTAFCSLRKNRKKRSRQLSGSSTASIGSTSTSTSESRTAEFERKALDGGWGWVVVFASFMVHCIADGVTMSFGVLYIEFLAIFDESKSLTSWIGSLFMAIPLLAGPVASALTDRYGCRAVTMCGAVVACIGFFLSAFANSIPVLFITVGLITGVGLAVCYVAAIVIVAFYFEKRRSLATGLAVAGSGIGTFIFAPIIQNLLEYFGWRGCLIIIAGIFLNLAVCGALMRDLEWTKKRPDKSMVSNTTFSSAQGSVNHSSDTLDAEAVPGSTIPSLGELKRLVQSGDITCLLSPDDPPMDRMRSESLVLLPTFINQSQMFPNDLLPFLSSNANAYKFVSSTCPHLLACNHSQSDLQSQNVSQEKKSKSQFVAISLEEDEKELGNDGDNNQDTSKDCDRNCLIDKIVYKRACSARAWSPEDATEISKGTLVMNGKPSFRMTCHRRSSLCLGIQTLPAAAHRNTRMTRRSMTFRGAMLNIHRNRPRASSCPNIFRNSNITITETKKQKIWFYFHDLKRLIVSCLDLSYCSDGAYLTFAVSNFILYVFYDTVYMYLADYAQEVGILPEKGANLISAIGILNCFGMIFMGYIGDKPWSSPLLIYNLSMVACGLSVIVMPFIVNYWMLAVASAVFGLFISANYALTAVILVDLISLEAFSKSYGLLLLIQGIANLIGPPLVGFMADATGNYTIPFVVSGFSIVICGVLLFLIPVIQNYRLQKLSTKDLPTNYAPKKTSANKLAKSDSSIINV